MKIKSLGYKVTDEARGIEFVISEESIIGLIEGLNIQSIKAVKPLKEASKPTTRTKRKQQSKLKQLEPEVKIPNPAERKTKELKDLPDEFTASNIIDMFVQEGYDKQKITSNISHDIIWLIKNNKIEHVEDTKDPKKYRVLSRDIPDHW